MYSIVTNCLLFLIEPSPSLLVMSSTDTIHTLSTNSHTPDTATTTTSMNIQSSDSLISNPSTTVSTEGTVQSSTVSNTLAAVISTVFILLVVTILVILIVNVLVCRRRWYKTSNGNDTVSSDERKTDIDQQSDGNVYYSV